MKLVSFIISLRSFIATYLFLMLLFLLLLSCAYLGLLLFSFRNCGSAYYWKLEASRKK